MSSEREYWMGIALQLKELLGDTAPKSLSRTHYTDWDTYLCTSCYADEKVMREDLKHDEDCRWTQIDKVLESF